MGDVGTSIAMYECMMGTVSNERGTIMGKQPGYTYCLCYYCFELAISNDERKPDYCNECSEAGCKDHAGLSEYSECQVERVEQ